MIYDYNKKLNATVKVKNKYAHLQYLRYDNRRCFSAPYRD